MSKNESKACEHSDKVLDSPERYYIKSQEHNNCLFCLIDDKGPMTQEEVSHYLGVSKMRISQIQRQAETKLKKRLYNADVLV